MDLIGTRLDIAKNLKEYVESKRSQDGTAVSAAFIKNGELVSAFACGTQDGNPEKPATVNDLFSVGSIGKIYCTLAVMKLVEMGKVCLDMPVIEYLPRFTMNDERYKQITLRMCLNHSSGLPGTNLKYCFCTKWVGETLYDNFYDYFSKSKLNDNPGNASVYCNDSYMLAEMIVAEVSVMSYIRFVQEYITTPAGALSTCSGENIFENRARIREKGKTNEYIMMTAGGGILTNLIDCAKIGYLFIDSKDILKSESLDETAYWQGKSFLSNVAEYFGLGWDFVNFSFEPYDFGENTLAKGGGTCSFSSFLMVSKKHNLSAAISFTNDNRMSSPHEVLSELCGIMLNEYGITQKESRETAIETDKKAIPNEVIQKFSGMYYSCYDGYRVSFDDNLLKIQVRQAKGWKDIITNGFFDGRCFISGKRKFAFDEYGESFYLIEEEVPMWGRMPFGQKRTSPPPVNATWKNRIGKKYIACDAHPNENAGFYTVIKEVENEENLLFFVYTGPSGSEKFFLPVITDGDNETNMFLNTPLHASRDGFAPFIYEKDGIEYLYAFGYTLIDSTYLQPLQTGQIVSEKGPHNKIYSMTVGNKIVIDKTDGVRVVVLDLDLNRKYDSRSSRELTETSDGFILFINEGSIDTSVEVCLK